MTLQAQLEPTPDTLRSLRVETSGKFFRLGRQKWFARGFTYGPFAPNSSGEALPERGQVARDLEHMRALGANLIRVYHVPHQWLLDEALERGLRVMIDVPWDKHRCFFEDWSAVEAARERVHDAAFSLGRHPATFAISVANEFPGDVVRFYGHSRLERFINGLIDTVKQAAPDCLATFVNFPTTEYLRASAADFCCFNVYLNDAEELARYLDRLQHLAGDLPLVLGEHGFDSLRSDETRQAAAVREQLDVVAQRGLAGSILFSYTDDWFTGGHRIEDWAFGVTRLDRNEKPAASVVRVAWTDNSSVQPTEPPKVSVVVCCYNGAETLRECLESLLALRHSNYEVILVDDGSTDDTPRIAEEFPRVYTIRQENRGLSVARNVGAEAATGAIVAYLDADCVADEDWLTYLVDTMLDQDVKAIGGPNLTPPTDSWTARCVAASPGNPGHVMIDDRCAEHVPGCNMAFDRETLLALGGFDPQFRAAGDDVDLCWRFLDAGFRIGFSPGAMVWHHRRNTVDAYLKQQKGYGRAEALLQLKHPRRYNSLGRSRWSGVIYGTGNAAHSQADAVIYHGRHGSAPFQTVYHRNTLGWTSVALSFEWHMVACLLLIVGLLAYWPFGGLALFMWGLTLAVVGRVAISAPLSKNPPAWARPLVAWLHLVQPIARTWHRQVTYLRSRSVPITTNSGPADNCAKRIAVNQMDLYWSSQSGLGRERFLENLEREAGEARWPGDFDDNWAAWDARLFGDVWHDVVVRTASEELGSSKRFTRARFTSELTRLGHVIAWLTLATSVALLVTGRVPLMVVGATAALLLWATLARSRRACLQGAVALGVRSGELAGLEASQQRGPPSSTASSSEAGSFAARRGWLTKTIGWYRASVLGQSVGSLHQ